MALHWNPHALGNVCILPAAAIQSQLHIASHLQWKVLLSFATAGDAFSVADCAKTLHKPEAVINEAITYWVQANVLIQDGTPAVQPAPQPPVDAAPAPVARPLPVKPTMADVLRRQKESAEFSSLLQDVSARLGKPITQGNMETLLYLYDTAGIPAQVIMLVVAYAVSRGKLNMRYIETTALGWLEDGITTVAAAEEHLALLEQMDDAAAKVRAWAQMKRELDFRQRGMAHTWIYVWKQSEDLIKVALQFAASTTKPLIPYANAILGRWHDEGVVDAVAAMNSLQKQTPAAKRAAGMEKSSLDIQSYEDMLADYVPRIPAKKEKR